MLVFFPQGNFECSPSPLLLYTILKVLLFVNNGAKIILISLQINKVISINV